MGGLRCDFGNFLFLLLLLLVEGQMCRASGWRFSETVVAGFVVDGFVKGAKLERYFCL